MQNQGGETPYGHPLPQSLAPMRQQQFETPAPHPIYPDEKESCFMGFVRLLFLVNRRPPCRQQADEACQPYIRDRQSLFVFVIRFCLASCFVINLLLVVRPKLWDRKYFATDTYFSENKGSDQTHERFQTFFWVGFVGAIISALVDAFFYVFTYDWLATYSSSKYAILLLVKFYTIACTSFNLVYPVPWLFIFTWIDLGLCLITVFACTIQIWNYRVFDKCSNELQYTLFFRAKVDQDWEEQSGWKSLNDRTELLSLRRRLEKLHNSSRFAMLCLVAFVFLLTMGNFPYEFLKIVTTQPRTWPEKTIEEMQINNAAKFRSHFAYRVLVVVIDGLRYDQLQSHPALKAYVNAPEFLQNSKTWKVSSELPSQSISNGGVIVASVSPENTGVLYDGDAEKRWKDVPFDNIFKEALLHNVPAAITGSLWWRTLLQDSLMPFQGDGLISDYYGTAAYDTKSSLPADVARTNLALSAMGSNTTNYQLLLTQYSGVDRQADYYGVTTEFNKQDTYATAISNTIAMFEFLRNAAPQNMLIVLTSSHGNIDLGGSGGIGNKNREVPMIFYMKNSNMSTRSASKLACPSFTGSYSAPTPSLLDLAPTVSAILGLPVPRQAEGNFLEELLWLLGDAQNLSTNTNSGNLQLYHLQDLFLQKRNFVCSYVQNVIMVESKDTCMSKFLGTTCLQGSTVSSASCGCTNEIYKLREYYNTKRGDRIHLFFWRNCVGNIVLGIILFVLVFYVTDVMSFCDLGSLFGKSELTYVNEIVEKQASGSNIHGPTESAASSTSGTLGATANRVAFLLAFILQLLYWGFVLGSFFVAYAVLGFLRDVFDSTYVHSDWWIFSWVIICVIPGMFMAWFINRVYKIKLFFTGTNSGRYGKQAKANEAELAYLIEKRYKNAQLGLDGHEDSAHNEPVAPSCGERFLRFLLDLEPDITTFVYLTKYYNVFWTLIVMIGLLGSCCPFTFYLPWIYSMPFITPFNWSYRFILLSLLLMGLPLLASCMLSMILWAPSSVWNNRWDGVYELRMAADMRRISAERLSLSSTKDPRKRAADLLAFMDRRNERFRRSWRMIHDQCFIDDIPLRLREEMRVMAPVGPKMRRQQDSTQDNKMSFIYPTVPAVLPQFFSVPPQQQQPQTFTMIQNTMPLTLPVVPQNSSSLIEMRNIDSSLVMPMQHEYQRELGPSIIEQKNSLYDAEDRDVIGNKGQFYDGDSELPAQEHFAAPPREAYYYGE